MRIKNLKRILSVFIASCMTFTSLLCHTTFASGEDDYITQKNIKVNGFVVKTTKELLFDTTFDARWILNYNGNYNKDLSIFSLLFSTDMYHDCYANSRANSTDKTIFLTDFGFENVEYHNIVSKTAGVDDDDTTNMTIGSKLFDFGGKEYRIIMAAFEGSAGEDTWISNFDIGSDSKNYYDATGDHPEWTNKNNHKGFDVTINRATDEINKYVNNLGDSSSVIKKYFFAGHSRGAGLVNVLAAKYADDSKNVLAYTFGTPMTTIVSQSKASSYKNIYNVINKDDFVSVMPLAKWGFRRYGKDIVISPSSNAACKSMIESIKGSEYKVIDMNNLINMLFPLATNRDDYYDKNKEKFKRVDVAGDTEDEAKACRNEIENVVNLLKVNKYVDLKTKPPKLNSSFSSNMFGRKKSTLSEIEKENDDIILESFLSEFNEDEIKTEIETLVEEETVVESETVNKDEMLDESETEIEEDTKLEDNFETKILDDEEMVDDSEIVNESEKYVESETKNEENIELEESFEIETLEEEVVDESKIANEDKIPDENETKVDENTELEKNFEVETVIQDEKDELEETTDFVLDEENIDEMEVSNVENIEDETNYLVKVDGFNGTYDELSECGTLDEAFERMKEIKTFGIYEDKYTIELKTSSAVLGNTLALMMAAAEAGDLAKMFTITLSYSRIGTEFTTELFSDVVGLFTTDTDAIADPHYVVSYYAIVKNYEPIIPNPTPRYDPINHGGSGSGDSAGSPIRDASGQIIGPGAVLLPTIEDKCPPRQ